MLSPSNNTATPDDMMSDTANHFTTTNRQSAPSSLESPEQVETLLHALTLLVEMANSNNDNNDDCFSSYSITEDALNDVCSNIPNDSLILQLKSSVERLLSTCRMLQHQVDAHVQERQRLQHAVEESHDRIQRLEQAITKLYKRNQRLKQTMQHDKERMLEKMEKHVQEMTLQHHQQQQVWAHERLLKLDNSTTTRDVDESSVSSMASCITDDGIATVSYDSAVQQLSSPLTINEEYILQFPQGTQIGLQFFKMKLKKRGLLNEAFQDDAESSKATHRELSFRHLKFRKHADNKEHHAYVVCGHVGFDRDLNTAPPLGARLIKVNGEWTSNMTLDQIRAAIQSNNNNKCEFFSLTFRNETLTAEQEEMLKHSVQVTQRQYQEANENKGGGGGAETEQQQHHHKNKPVIICMHEGGPTRFSSFLQGARSRTLSDNAIRSEGASNGNADGKVSSNKQDVVISPSTKSFYSILHGSSDKTMEEGASAESSHCNSERESSLSDDANPSSSSASRFASIFGISRSRTFSDNNVTSEDETSEFMETFHHHTMSPSPGRGLYSILHGQTNTTTSNEVDTKSPSRAINDVPSSCSEEDDDEYIDSGNEDTDSRMSVLFNSVRRRAFSETADELGDPPNSKLETEVTDNVGTPEAVGKRLSFFVMGSRNRVDADPIESDNPNDAAESIVATSPLPHSANETSTGASGNFHSGIKSMGSRFKSWAPGGGTST